MSVTAYFLDPVEGYHPADTPLPEWDGPPDRFMRFPAGEAHVVEGSYPFEIEKGFVLIQGADANDYLSAAMWIDLMHQRGAKVAALVPYLPGARQDRGRPFGAQVYANLINSLGADQVITVDPHSSVMPELVDNLTVIRAWRVVQVALGTSVVSDTVASGYVGVICPDEGAYERTEQVGHALQLPVYHATKKRDFATGKLSGFACEKLPEEGRLLVVDDICDGGGTFLGLAEATGLGPDRLDLWVTHGIFSGDRTASVALSDAFGDVFTTDSHPGYKNSYVSPYVFRLLPQLASVVWL